MLCRLKELFDPVPTKIIYCYREYQVAFDDMGRTISNIDFVEGFPHNLHDMLVNDKNSYGWSHVRMFKRPTHVRIVHQIVTPSRHVSYVFSTKPFPTWQTITNYQFEFALHDHLQKSERFARYGHIGSSNVSKQCKLFARVIHRRNTETMWLLDAWFTPVNTGKP